MCGIFGYVSKAGAGPDLERLARIAKTTESRGPHAFGMAWVDARGRLKMYKSTGRITQHLALLDLAADAVALVGHCRYATQGDYRNNLNNHPHSVDGGWLVHNGVIPDYEEIIDQHGLAPVTDCDSEVLGLLIEELTGPLYERTIQAAQICSARALALAAIWKHPGRLVLVRQGNPVHFGENQDGHYFGSLLPGLPSGGYMLRDHTCLVFSFSDKKGTAATFTAYDMQDQSTPRGRATRRQPTLLQGE